jgi:hypothetical protein
MVFSKKKIILSLMPDNGFEMSSADIASQFSSRFLKPELNLDFRLPSASALLSG